MPVQRLVTQEVLVKGVLRSLDLFVLGLNVVIKVVKLVQVTVQIAEIERVLKLVANWRFIGVD